MAKEGEKDTLEAALVARERKVAERERAIDARTEALVQREREADERKKQFDVRDRDLTVAGNKLKQDQDALATKRQSFELDRATLEKRDRVITQREIEADAGFATKNREALAALTKEHTTLRGEVQRVQAEIDAARLEGITKLETSLAKERQVRLAALDMEVKNLRERAGGEIAEEIKKERAKLANERVMHDTTLAQERKRLADEQLAFTQEASRQRAEITTKEAALRGEQSRLAYREQEVEGLRAGIKQSIERQSLELVTSLERRLQALRDEHQLTLDARVALEKRLDGYEQLFAQYDGRPEEMQRRLDDARRKITSLEKEILSLPSADQKQLLVELQEKSRVWEDEQARMQRELAGLRAEKGRWVTDVHELESQRDQREVAERRLDVLHGEMERYKADVERMRRLYEPPADGDKRVGSIENPWRKDLKRAPDAPLKELEWLKRIEDACAKSGMVFPKRLLQAFHTSLKAAELSPLTVLAGVSGTGKSELPRLYSRFGGIAFLSLAVQPNWDSPQSLFGFFNSVDNRFNATTVLRAMVQAQHAPDKKYEYGLKDRLLLVLLDEMNLAHVEQYFSDLLSRLEQRRGESADVTLDIDLGAEMPPYPLRLGRNVMWVGTMNEDETTKALSDKVVDRSNLMHFPRPKKLYSRADVTLDPEVPLLPEVTWRRWIQTKSPFNESQLEPFRNALEEMNKHLENVGRALGHRVWQAVEYYMANHPETIEAREKDEKDAIKQAMQRAFEDQLVLKVMPKLRGIETTGIAKTKCLDPIRAKLMETTPGLVDDFEIACRVGYGAFVWNSARYLENDK